MAKNAITAVMVDSREPEWVQKLAFSGAMKIITPLEFGDLMITAADGALVCVERKTPTDFLGSIQDNRVFLQCAGMRKMTEWSYLIITGTLTPSADHFVIADSRATKWRWESVQGALLSIQELGVNIIYCANDNDYEATVLRLCGRERVKEKVLEPHVAARVMSHGEIILTGLPGIGIERAGDLLREFGNNTAWALSWLTQSGTVSQVAGIGDGVKKSVRFALNLADDQELTIQKRG